MLFIGTTLLLVGALIQALSFRLNKTTHKILVDEIDRLKASGSKLRVEAKTRGVIEDLTGYRYDTLWCEESNNATQDVAVPELIKPAPLRQE